MALDLRGFTSEPQNFSGLTRLGENLEQRRMQKEYDTQKSAATKTANSKYINEYFDPKEYLTGSIYDRQTGVLLSDALKKAEELNAKGVPLNEITMAVSPLVNKANRYFSNGKLYSQQKKEALEKASKITGIDAGKLAQSMDDLAFPINPETGEREVESYDPNKNYADLALNDGDVYNNKSFDEYMKGAGKNTYNTKLKLTNGRGGYTQNEVAVTSPSFMIPDEDDKGGFSGFVPKYEMATSKGQNVPHDFYTPEGMQTGNVRMVTQDVYQSLPNEAKAYLRQEAHKYADMNGIDRNSQEVNNFQRALAYDELKRSEKISSSYRQIEDKKETPIKIYAPKQVTTRQPSETERSNKEKISNLHRTLDDKKIEADGYMDVSSELHGVQMVNRRGDRISVTNAKYNPSTKKFKIETLEGVEEMPYHKLSTLYTTANPTGDLKWFGGFESYNRKENSPAPQPKPAPKSGKVTDPSILKLLNQK